MSSKKSALRVALFTGGSLLALVAGPFLINSMSGDVINGGVAFAESSGGHTDSGGSKGKGKGGAGYKGGKTTTGSSGGSDSHGHETVEGLEEDDDSDKRGPKYSGGRDTGKPMGAGSKRGDIYGDMFVLLRDENGVPITITINGEEYVQPIDANGDVIPLDEEGQPIDETLTLEVELGRLNVGRAPTSVLDNRTKEVINSLNSAVEISVDVAGRLTFTLEDGTVKTVDSPLENLALYTALMTTGTIGLDSSANLPSELSFLNDGVFSVEDFKAAASFLAAASDKSGNLTIDEVVYMNTFLSINGSEPTEFVDFSTFNYDRSDVYENVTADVMILQPDGTWVVETVNIYEKVFNSTDYVSNDGGVDGFAQAADDARAVIEYVHELAPPES